MSILLYFLLLFQIPDDIPVNDDKFDIHIVLAETYNDPHSKLINTALKYDYSQDPNLTEEQKKFINQYRRDIYFLSNVIWHTDKEVDGLFPVPSYSFNERENFKKFGDFPEGYKVLCCPFDFLMHFKYIVRLKKNMDDFDKWRAEHSYTKAAYWPVLATYVNRHEHELRVDNIFAPNYTIVRDEYYLGTIKWLECHPEPPFYSETRKVITAERLDIQLDGRKIEHNWEKIEFTPGTDVCVFLKQIDMNTGLLDDYIRLIEEGKIYKPTLDK